jgi:hypothetical protein
MQCPHCLHSLLRKQRTGRTCSYCKKRFALDPKENAFRLHDLRLAKVAARLRTERGLQFTAGQLYYAVLRPLLRSFKPPTVARALRGVAIVAVIAAVVTWALWSIGWALLVAAAILLGALPLVVRHVRTHQLPRLPASLQEFNADVIAAWEATYGTRLEGLASGRSDEQDAAGVVAVVACPNREVLHCLAANGVAKKLRIGLVSTEPDGRSDAEHRLIVRLRHEPALPLLLLHDASPEGCALGGTIAHALGLSPEHRIVDLGLHPRHAAGLQLLCYGEPMSDVNVPTLAADEAAWLAAGWRAPILGLSPARTIARVEQGVARVVEGAAARRPRWRGNGFMSWPS